MLTCKPFNEDVVGGVRLARSNELLTCATAAAFGVVYDDGCSGQNILRTPSGQSR